MTSETQGWRSRARLIESLFRGDEQLSEVASAMQVGVKDLAKLADDETIVRTIGLLRMLGDVKAEQYFRPLRLHALARLVELATQTDNPELARKACVDLLKVDMDALGGRAQPAWAAQPAREVADDPHLLRQALVVLDRRGGAGMRPAMLESDPAGGGA